MEKNAKIGIAALLIIVIAGGVGGGIGAFLLLNQPTGTTEGEVILTIHGSTVQHTFTMSELESSKYKHFSNQMFFYDYESGSGVSLGNETYSGVSLKSIIETEDILYNGSSGIVAVNMSFYDDGFSPHLFQGHGPVNLTKVMEADYEECILAYGGEDFVSDPDSDDYDGPIKSVLNYSASPDWAERTKSFFVYSLDEIEFF